MQLIKHSKIWSFIAKFALMLLALWFVARGVDGQEFAAMLREQNRSVFVEVCLLIFLQMLLGAVRWHLIIGALVEKGRDIGFLSALKTYYISVFFNCCLPGTVGGDVVRVFLVKSEHTPLPLAISSVVIDRMIALLALVVMGLATMPFFAFYLGLNPWFVTVIFAFLFVSGLFVLFNSEKILRKIPFLRERHWLVHLLQNIRRLFIYPRPALLSLLYAVAAHFMFCYAAYLLAESLGSPITLADSVTLIPWVLLISIIPISIGGWGLREAAAVYLLGLINVPQAAALALSVQIGLFLIVVSLPAGLLWLVRKR